MGWSFHLRLVDTQQLRLQWLVEREDVVPNLASEEQLHTLHPLQLPATGDCAVLVIVLVRGQRDVFFLVLRVNYRLFFEWY